MGVIIHVYRLFGKNGATTSFADFSTFIDSFQETHHGKSSYSCVARLEKLLQHVS